MADRNDAFLDALGRRDLDLDLTAQEIMDLRRAMTKLSATARLAHVAADRPNDTSMDESLAKELRVAAHSRAFDVFERTRIAEILDENGALVFQEITRESVPTEDLEFLAQCGIKEPEAEITISLRRLKAGYWMMSEDGRSTARILEHSRMQILHVAEGLSQQDAQQKPAVSEGQSSKKRRKIFNGVGKILSGVVAGTGNVLMGIGAVPAAGGVAAPAVIASAAASIGIIMQGIGDLRGE